MRQAVGSKPVGLVDNIAQRPACREPAAVVEEDVEAAVVEIGAVAGGVRSNQHVGRRPERMAGILAYCPPYGLSKSGALRARDLTGLPTTL